MDEISLNGGVHQRAGVQDLLRAQEERPAVAPPEPADTGSSEDQEGAASQQQQDRADSVLRNVFGDENIRLKIEVDKDTGDFVYLGVDSETGEVVKQYPPEEIVRRVKHFRNVAGLAVDTKS